MLFCQLADQFTDFNDLLRSSPTVGSSRMMISGNPRDCLRKSDSLLITFGQVLDQPVLYIHDLHHQHDLLNLLLPFRFWDLLQFRYELQVFHSPSYPCKAVASQADNQYIFCRLRFLQYIVPVDQHFTFCGAKIACHNIHRCGLSGTVRSQKSIDLPGIYSKIQMIYSQM